MHHNIEQTRHNHTSLWRSQALFTAGNSLGISNRSRNYVFTYLTFWSLSIALTLLDVYLVKNKYGTSLKSVQHLLHTVWEHSVCNTCIYHDVVNMWCFSILFTWSIILVRIRTLGPPSLLGFNSMCIFYFTCPENSYFLLDWHEWLK